MNMEELEAKLRELKPRAHSAAYERRVLAQRPPEPARPCVPWWRRQVSLPLPALAALVLLLFAGGFLISGVLTRHNVPMPGGAAGTQGATGQTGKPHGAMLAAGSDTDDFQVSIVTVGK